MRRAGDAADADPGCLEVIGEGLLAALAVLLVIAVMVFILVPMLVAIVDIVVVALLALLGLAGRLVFRRPWTVEARAGDGSCLVWRVVGWRASGDHVARVTELLGSGIIPPGATATTSLVGP